MTRWSQIFENDGASWPRSWSTARILPWVFKHFRSSAYGDQSIHAKIIITLVFLKHTITGASSFWLVNGCGESP